MILSDKDFEDLEKECKRGVPFNVLASRYQLTEMELIKEVRQKGIIRDVRPKELQYIKDNIGSKPANYIQNELGLTKTQFGQICQKLRLKIVKSVKEWTLEEAIEKTRWLIEEKLGMQIDDFLPRRLTIDHFFQNDLYGCIDFANSQKKDDGYYRHFPVVAFLVCQSYRDKYRPFQFRHAKTNQYFRGKEGRKNVINAIRWIIEEKNKIKPANFKMAMTNKYFLKPRELAFWGVSPHYYRNYFKTKSELINELAKIYATEEDSALGNLKYRRQQLISAGIPIDKCYVKTCFYDDKYGIEIHHIIPQKDRNMTKINIDSAQNLIPLCPNHHAKAKTFAWKQLLKDSPEQWREIITNYLSKEG